jgi:heme O synthase-like polyprenyltransferase
MAPKIRTRRRRTWLYALIALIAVSALIYWEQTALLYVLSTLAVSALMLIVAFAKLETTDKETIEEAGAKR